MAYVVNQGPTDGKASMSSQFDQSLPKLKDADETSDTARQTLRALRSEDNGRESRDSSMTSNSVGTNVLEMNRSQPSTASRKPYFKPSLKVHARSSIPSRLQPAEYGRQCVAAAYASRLDPYRLHQDEHRRLRRHLCHLHVTAYLNIRNGILRLWIRNPSVSVTLEEAVGCTREERWTTLACFAYEWLIRNGYINHGCVEVPQEVKAPKTAKSAGPRETIVIVGAGIAGLSCARQLSHFAKQYPDYNPRIIIVEGRGRIGGRIYSHPLVNVPSKIFRDGQRPTAEMGAQIIVGFEHGNPLDAILRGQLALECHALRDLSTLYDFDGSPVAEGQDTMVERLYNDILDRSGKYRCKRQAQDTAMGDKNIMDAGKDITEDDGLSISQYEEASASGVIDSMSPTKSKRRGVSHKAAKNGMPDEQVEADMNTHTQLPAAAAAQEMGFHLRQTTKVDQTIDLDPIVAHANASLGAVLDEGVRQYTEMLELEPKAMRLLNWHFANLEYANATNVRRLSLSGWDQDSGNEFEGAHAQVIGGYQQVPRALWRHPDRLDVRTSKVITEIRWDEQSQGGATVKCEDDEEIFADKVVLTAPLGVLKRESIEFVPPLPDWKKAAISRLGFGLLNKLVLVFNEPFWDVSRDMFGLLRAPKSGTGSGQGHYRARRGQFYLFWNCVRSSGLPVLIALMAGDAAQEAESSSDHELVSSCLAELRKIHGEENVSEPVETIVTRWGSDPFAHGTYSFVDVDSVPQDYDSLAKRTGNLFFAGEATCGSHPATVHGAYISGLRAASEILEATIGPIYVPEPLVGPAAEKMHANSNKHSATSPTASETPKRRGDLNLPAGTTSRPVKEHSAILQQEWDDALWDYIYARIGYAPPEPVRSGTNPFLLFQKDRWDTCKEKCDSLRQVPTSKHNPRAGRDEVRIELGKMWKALSDADRAPYIKTSKMHKVANDKANAAWMVECAEWERQTWEVKDEWIRQGNSFEQWTKRKEESGFVRAGKRKLVST